MLYDRPIQDSFDAQFEPTHQAASAARQQARHLLDAAGVPPSVAADLELIIAELTANAVEQQPHSPVRLELSIGEGAVTITVSNEANGDDRPCTGPIEVTPSDRPPEELAERGWGLAIVERLSHELTIEVCDGWTTLRVLRRF